MQSAEDAECAISKFLKLNHGDVKDSSSHSNIGRMCHEHGLLPCCVWGSSGASEHLLRRKRKREELPDILESAKGFLRPGNGLDRSFLDGYSQTEWYQRDVHTPDSRVCKLMLRALAAPQSIAFRQGGSTLVEVFFQVQCTIEDAEPRILTFPVLLPAPIGAYIVTANKTYGGRFCVNLRISPKINEILARRCGKNASRATIILGPTRATERFFQPQTIRLAIEWKEGGIRAINFTLKTTSHAKPGQKLAGRLQVSLAHTLRVLLSLPMGPLVSDDVDILSDVMQVVRESLLRRTYINLKAGGLCARDDALVSCVEGFLQGDFHSLPSAEQEQSARAVIALLLRLPKGSCQKNDLFSDAPLSHLLSCRHADAVVAPSLRIQTESIIDALDLIARLLCAAVQIHAHPECRESPEKNMDIRSPSSASAAALRYAVKNTLDIVVKDIKGEFKKLAASSSQHHPPPVNIGKRGAGSAQVGVQTISLHWRSRESPCPVCGTELTANAASCSICEMEFRDEKILFQLNETEDFVVAPGSGVWWTSSYRTLLKSVAFVSRCTRDHSTLNLAFRKLLASFACNSLPMRIIRHLKGGKIGVHASEATQHKKTMRATASCVRSDDITLHDATTVQTGIHSSQIHNAWRRRRANRRYRGLWDTLSLHEKTTQRTRHTPPGILFAQSALLDEEDERAVVEATVSAFQRVKALTEPAEGGDRSKMLEDFAQVTIEGRNLTSCSARWQRKTAEKTHHMMTHTNDYVGGGALLTLEQSMRLPRIVREELDMRMGSFRSHEVALCVGATRGLVKILKRVRLLLESKEEIETEDFTLGNRLPMAGDYVRKNATSPWLRVAELLAVWVRSAHELNESYACPVKDLEKVPQRRGDACGLPPLAFVNAVLAEHQRHVDVRLSGGHAVVLVQRAALVPSTKTSYARLFEQFQCGQLGLWHASTLATEEHLLGEQTFSERNAPLGTYVLPFAERQIRCARANATPPPVGHGIRHGAHMRALGSSCSVWTGVPGSEAEVRTFAGRADPSLLAPSSWSRGDLTVTGSCADVTLLAVALLDDVDGTSYEDAGSMDRSVCAEQGRCFFSLTTVSAPSAAKILARSEIVASGLAPEEALLHLDSSGRARGFVLKGAVLAWLQDDRKLLSPCDAWVEVWIYNLREVPCVILVQEQRWVSGIKVVGLLQKSVLTTVNHGLCCPTPVSFVRAEASCVSRNAAATYVSALALKLLLARGARLLSERSFKHLGGLRNLFLEEACNLRRVVAARDLTPGLCRYDAYPVVKNGRCVGRARVLYCEMNIPLDKSAPRVLASHLGPNCKKMRGFEPGSGQALEITERAVTTTALKSHKGRSFEVNRPEGQIGLLRADYVSACSSALELLDLGLVPM